MILLIYMKDIRIHFDKHNLFEVALIGLLFYALWTIGTFLLVLGAALIVSTFIEDFVVRGEKFNIPRLASVIMFYLIAIIVIGAVLIFIVPILGREILSLAQVYPEIQTFIENNSLFSQLSAEPKVSGILDVLKDPGTRDEFMTQILGFFGGIFNMLIIFVVSFYLSINHNGIDNMLRIFTPLRYEDMVVNMWHRVQLKVGSWFRGQLIIAGILTVITYAGLALGGIPYAFLLALLAGVFGLVPYGIFLALIPAVIIGFGHGGILTAAFIAAGYFGLQQVLDLGLQPLIVKKLTGVPSLVVVLSVVIGAKLFGLYGLLLAMPIALFAMELIAESEKHKSSQRAPLVNHQEAADDVTIVINNTINHPKN
ncbi:MAG: putative PurR-regulated permease PerM [Crocinitomicaceae bacterium]|jgi:predicted PurR-regulated permease PerM